MWRPMADFSGPDETHVYGTCMHCREYQKTYQQDNKDDLKKKRQQKRPKKDAANTSL
jgi:hypothetical protein